MTIMENDNEILLGTGARNLGFHPVYFLRSLISIRQFNDKNIRKIIRDLTFHYSQIGTRHSGTDVGNILSFIKKTEKVTGEILELGTWLGGFTILMAKYLNLIKSDKRIITCDSFEGMPKKITGLGEDYPAGLLKVDYEFVKEKFRTYSVDNRITIIKGFIEKSLQTMKEKNFSFAFIDTAAYDSMKTALEFIYPRLSTNGIVAVDDYSKSTQDFFTKRAVDEFCEKYNLELIPKPFAHILKK